MPSRFQNMNTLQMQKVEQYNQMSKAGHRNWCPAFQCVKKASQSLPLAGGK